MTTATLILLALFAAAFTWAAVVTARNRQQKWKRCPLCRSYFCGNVITKDLPAESNGVLHPQICKSCMESELFLSGRNQNFTQN